MPEVQNVRHIGMRRAHAMANLTADEQLNLIAEGLPILMQSAGSLLEASKELNSHPRSAAMLRSHAVEEIAKILILVDLVRCPVSQRPSRVGKMTKWFYDHLARLIYVEAQSWKPMHARQLQEYIDEHRRTHYLEGAYGEYIMPNFEVYRRESDMYADIEGEEDGTLHWSDPQSTYRDFDTNALLTRISSTPQSWLVCTALQDFGVFTRQGLDVVSSTWKQVGFREEENLQDTNNLTYEMVCALEKASLLSDNAEKDQLGILYRNWQLPMYRMDFSPIEISLEDLKDERDRNLAFEIGY
ncbi:MAG: AbiV family abortive infection protein [Oleispira sp.]|nr:AbiV family abortive infection protein [Oleispira sp.]